MRAKRVVFNARPICDIVAPTNRFIGPGKRDCGDVAGDMRNLRQKLMVKAAAFGVKHLLPRFDGALNVFVDRSDPADYGAPEGTFTTSDGRSIPILPRYRYSVKLPLFRAIDTLAALDRRGLLTDEERKRFAAIKGTRTLTVSGDEQIAFARSVARRMPDMFVPGWEAHPEGPSIRQTPADVTRIVGKFQAQHERMFALFAAGNILKLKPGASVLEIGYTTGGLTRARRQPRDRSRG